MNECLNEEALVELLLGEGSAEAQLHVKSCATCSRSYKNLAQNMRLIEVALSAKPPPVPLGMRLLSTMRTLAPELAAAVAVFVLGFWLGQRFFPSNRVTVTAKAVNIAPMSPSGRMAMVERRATELPSSAERQNRGAEPASASYVSFLADNFEQDDTCTGPDRQFDPACSRSWMVEGR